MKIIDIKTPNNLNLKYKDRIEAYCAEQINSHTEPAKFKNYTSAGLDIENHLFFSASFDAQDRLVGFCGIYNGGRYATWVHRIHNRTFVAPEFRHKNISMKPRFFTVEITRHQLSIWSNPEVLFISIEEPKRSFRMLKYIGDLITHPKDIEWNALDGYAQVVQGKNKECFQKVIYSNFCKFPLKLELPVISELEYEQRFLINSV